LEDLGIYLLRELFRLIPGSFAATFAKIRTAPADIIRASYQLNLRILMGIQSLYNVSKIGYKFL